MFKLIPAAPAMLFALAVAGCGAESSNEAAVRPSAENELELATPAQRDVCSFVSKDAVAAATGEKILNAKAEGDICTYETDDAMASSVQVEIKQSGGAEEMKVARTATGVLGEMGEGMKGSGDAEGDVGQAISESAAAPGIGDEAFFGPNQQLHVLKGDVYFAITPPAMRSRMSGGNPMLAPQAKQEMASEIARHLITKL